MLKGMDQQSTFLVLSSFIPYTYTEHQINCTTPIFPCFSYIHSRSLASSLTSLWVLKEIITHWLLYQMLERKDDICYLHLDAYLESHFKNYNSILTITYASCFSSIGFISKNGNKSPSKCSHWNPKLQLLKQKKKILTSFLFPAWLIRISLLILPKY